MSQGESGQALPLTLIVVVVATILLLAIGKIGAVVSDATRAQTAADGAALAGVLDGRVAAERVARENDGVLISYRQQGDEIQVEVRLGNTNAVARAKPGFPDFE